MVRRRDESLDPIASPDELLDRLSLDLADTLTALLASLPEDHPNYMEPPPGWEPQK
jgi:hypothetical protein